MKLFRWLNAVVTRNLRTIEMVGVLMRIFSFSLVSWLGPQSPFLFVWAFNTLDAVLLSWCAIIKKDAAYTVLNVFWNRSRRGWNDSGVWIYEPVSRRPQSAPQTKRDGGSFIKQVSSILAPFFRPATLAAHS